MDKGTILRKKGKNQVVSSVRKAKSRHAARTRRSCENQQFTMLAKLLPLPETIASQLDKASVVKLAVSYLKYRDLHGKDLETKICRGKCFTETCVGFRKVFEKHLGVHILRAIDGFLICISQDGKCLYVSETVSSYLGISQLDFVGSSVFNYVYPDDQKEFSDLLCKPNLFDGDVPGGITDSLEFQNTFQRYSKEAGSCAACVSTFIRMKCTLMKRGGSLFKCGYKVIHLSGRFVPYRSIHSRNIEKPYVLVALVQPLPPSTLCELNLESQVFVSRVGMDLKIVFCEGRIRKFMDFEAKDIVGASAYEFYHLGDMPAIQEAHSHCVQKGQVLTRAYRWMDKNGGWVWMQTVASIIKRSSRLGEQSQILCINYVCSGVEHKQEVMSDLTLKRLAGETLVPKMSAESAEVWEDYDLLHSCASPQPSVSHSPVDSSNVIDQSTFMLSLQYSQCVDSTRRINATVRPRLHQISPFCDAGRHLSSSIGVDDELHIPFVEQSQAWRFRLGDEPISHRLPAHVVNSEMHPVPPGSSCGIRNYDDAGGSSNESDFSPRFSLSPVKAFSPFSSGFNVDMFQSSCARSFIKSPSENTPSSICHHYPLHSSINQSPVYSTTVPECVGVGYEASSLLALPEASLEQGGVTLPESSFTETRWPFVLAAFSPAQSFGNVFSPAYAESSSVFPLRSGSASAVSVKSEEKRT